MPKRYKRFGGNRQTKLSRTPISVLRGNTIQSSTGIVDLKKPADLKQYLEFLGHSQAPGIRELAQAAKEVSPRRNKAYTIFEVDFKKCPLIRAMGTPACSFEGLIFVDSNVPKIFRQFLADHEIREIIMEKAGYSPNILPVTTGTGHLEAKRREKRDLERQNLWEKYLKWAKRYHNWFYAERKKLNRKH